MSLLHLPWLELSLLITLFGAVWVGRVRNPDVARQHSVFFKGLALISAVGAWQDFATLHVFEAHDRFDVLSSLMGSESFVIDELSAPLLPLAALLHLATAIATLRTKVKRISFSGSLMAEAILRQAQRPVSYPRHNGLPTCPYQLPELTTGKVEELSGRRPRDVGRTRPAEVGRKRH